ncbi:MAG TPA: hypothetical protein VMH41_09760 [Mycobacteriales bacterium]|nr:hypothetical protein [Mycobacteriales bacterium]
MTDHRALASGYFNAAWDLIDLDPRTAEQDRDMIGIALASRQHWIEAGGTPTHLATSDWQVAHAASLAGFGELAMTFALAAVERAESNPVPDWLVASAHEGLARAYASVGDVAGYEREAATTRELLEKVSDPDNRDLVAGQLASIPVP